MSRFFVGQRVRIKWSDFYPALCGQKGRIIAVSADGGATGKSEWIVAPDCWGSEFEPPGWGDDPGWARFAPNSKQLEPTLPSGHQPAELSIHELLPFLKDKSHA